MIEYNQQENQIWVSIPVSGIHELSDLQSGVLGILKKIETEEAEKALKEDLKWVYRFLKHLLMDEVFFHGREKLLLESQEKINFPPKVELAVSLIKAELKNLKFVNDMNQQGVEASAGLWDFGTLILGLLGFDNNFSDGLNEWYFTRQNELIKNIESGDDPAFSEAAFDFYVDLVIKLREMSDW